MDSYTRLAATLDIHQESSEEKSQFLRFLALPAELRTQILFDTITNTAILPSSPHPLLLTNKQLHQAAKYLIHKHLTLFFRHDRENPYDFGLNIFGWGTPRLLSLPNSMMPFIKDVEVQLWRLQPTLHSMNTKFNFLENVIKAVGPTLRYLAVGLVVDCKELPAERGLVGWFCVGLKDKFVGICVGLRQRSEGIIITPKLPSTPLPNPVLTTPLPTPPIEPSPNPPSVQVEIVFSAVEENEHSEVILGLLVEEMGNVWNGVGIERDERVGPAVHALKKTGREARCVMMMS